MKFVHRILVLFITIFMIETVKADLMDIALPTMFGSKDKTYMKCYDCKNITYAACNNIPPNSTLFVKECNEGAKGCVKKFYNDDGYTVMSRECYYGPFKVLQDFRCEGTKVNYPQEKCHLCTTDLCNSSTDLFSLSHIGLYTMVFPLLQVLKFLLN